MKKKLSVLNLTSVIIVIAVNYVTQVFRVNETTIGEVSNKYFNLITPAGYAFAIWGLIFLALLAYGIYQVKTAFNTNERSGLIEKTEYWFILANLLNCAWVFAFSFDYTGLSVLIMLGILFSLLKIVVNNQMENAVVSRSEIIFGWLPIGIYTGWITVATIVNIAAYLSKLNWDGAFLGEQQWTLVMIAVATLVNVFMVWKRQMHEFALVGVWAFFAIYKRHEGSIDSIAYMALTCCVILTLVVITNFIQTRKKNLLLNSDVKA